MKIIIKRKILEQLTTPGTSKPVGDIAGEASAQTKAKVDAARAADPAQVASVLAAATRTINTTNRRIDDLARSQKTPVQTGQAGLTNPASKYTEAKKEQEAAKKAEIKKPEFVKPNVPVKPDVQDTLKKIGSALSR